MRRQAALRPMHPGLPARPRRRVISSARAAGFHRVSPAAARLQAWP
ncbi:hypothetical protein AZ28_0469 [Bordetella pertussis B200]|nr:hypothetical protein AZ28_0469 [Bordetella pertussis B200]